MSDLIFPGAAVSCDIPGDRFIKRFGLQTRLDTVSGDLRSSFAAPTLTSRLIS